MESLPRGLALTLLQEEWQEDDRYACSKLLQGGLSPIYCPQESSPEFDADTLEAHMKTMMYMCLVWTCPAWLRHCVVQLPRKEKKEEVLIIMAGPFLPLSPSAKAAALVTILEAFISLFSKTDIDVLCIGKP